jgi:hypothetical protein
MNKFILSIFLCLSIFSSVQSFAHPNELTESEHITQLLEGLKGYAKTLGHSYEPVEMDDLVTIKQLPIAEALKHIDRLIGKASGAEWLKSNIIKSLLGVHKDLEASFQRMAQKISSVEKERNSLRETLLAIQEAEDFKNLDIKPDDLSDLPIFKTPVFSVMKKHGAERLRKTLAKYFESSHDFITDSEVIPISLETLTIGQLLIIFNEDIEKTLTTNPAHRFYSFFFSVGVPPQILIKMIMAKDRTHPKKLDFFVLEKTFHYELYMSILNFMITRILPNHWLKYRKLDDISKFEKEVEFCTIKELMELLIIHQDFYSFFTSEQRTNIKLFLKSVTNDEVPLTRKQLFEGIPHI